jgi:hypothetical protein
LLFYGSTYENYLKGQCHETFCFRFFHESPSLHLSTVANCHWKKFEMAVMVYSGAWGKLIHKKIRSRKSRDSIPLIHFYWKFNVEILNYIFMRTFHIASRVITFFKKFDSTEKKEFLFEKYLLFVPKLVCLVSLTQQNICQVAKQTNDNINFPNQMFAIYFCI